MTTWVYIRSWHVWDTMAVSRAGKPYKTLCGRKPGDGAVETDGGLPLDDKSCETCLRLMEQRR